MTSTTPASETVADFWVHTRLGPALASTLAGAKFDAQVDGHAYGCAGGFVRGDASPSLTIQTEHGHSVTIPSTWQVFVLQNDNPATVPKWKEAGDVRVGERAVLGYQRENPHWYGQGEKKHEGARAGKAIAEALRNGNMTDAIITLRHEAASSEFALGMLSEIFSDTNPGAGASAGGIFAHLADKGSAAAIQRILLRMGILSACEGSMVLVPFRNWNAFLLLSRTNPENEAFTDEVRARTSDDGEVHRSYFSSPIESIRDAGEVGCYFADISEMGAFDANGIIVSSEHAGTEH